MKVPLRQLCYWVGNKSSLGGEFYENGEFATRQIKNL